MNILPIKTGSSGNLYILKTQQNNNYLIEAGVEKKATLKALYKLGKVVSDFKGVFISHIHGDHCQSAKWLNEYMPVYSNREVMQNGYKGQVVVFGNKYKFEDLIVLPFEVKHGNVLNNAYIFKDEKSTVLFMTDFFTFESNISKIKFTEIFIECNWTKDLLDEALKRNDEEYSKYERQMNTHCSLEILVNILKSLNLSECNKITLIHPSKYMCNKELVLAQIKNMFPHIEVEFAKNLI